MNRSKLLSSLMFCAAVTLAGCVTDTAPPPGLDLSSTRASSHHTYTVHIAPVATPVAVNQIHAWQIDVTSESGEPIKNAHISVGGGMPQHGHGFPTQPRVTKELSDGRYLLEGMKFSMVGWWEIKLDIKSTLGQDQVTFNTVLPASAKVM